MIDVDRAGYADPPRALTTETSNVSVSFPKLAGEAGQYAVSVEPAWLAASTSESAQPQTFDLAQLWQRVCLGTWRFRDTFSTGQRHFAVLECSRASPPNRLHIRNQKMLERVLTGQVPKAVAFDMHVAISTAATGMQEYLRWTGLQCRVSSAPVLLTMAARAAVLRQPMAALGRLTRVSVTDDSYWLVSAERPDLVLPPIGLSEAETSVVRQLVAGLTHADIAEQRATSPRTIANQLASAFKKFGVSGRSAILHQLITHSLERQRAVGIAELAV